MAASDPNIGGLSARDFFLEAGNSGLKIFGGFVVEDYEPQLRGIKAARAYREMADTSPTVGAVLFVIGQAIRNIEWHVAPADQSVASLVAQEFYESLLEDMEHTWGDFISEVLSMFVYGYAPFEIVLKLRQGKQSDRRLSSRHDDGMIGIRKLALRGQDTILRWVMDSDNNEVLGLVQMPWTGGYRTIPREKLLLFRTISQKNNPEGRSLLRSAYRPYYFAKRMEEIEAIGIERDLAGLPQMRVPAELIAAAKSGATNTQATQAAATLAAYQTLVTNIRRNTQEGVLLPSDRDDKGNPLFELTLLSSGGSRTFDTNNIVNRYVQQIATSAMADFLLLGHAARGSQALGTSKVEMFYSAVQGMVQAMADTLNHQLVPLLGDINGIPPENQPSFYTDKAEQVDLGRLGAYINALAASGMQMFPDRDLEAYLREIAGLPEPSDETLAQQDAEVQQQRQQAQQRSLPAPMLGGGGPHRPQETGATQAEEHQAESQPV